MACPTLGIQHRLDLTEPERFAFRTTALGTIRDLRRTSLSGTGEIWCARIIASLTC